MVQVGGRRGRSARHVRQGAWGARGPGAGRWVRGSCGGGGWAGAAERWRGARAEPLLCRGREVQPVTARRRRRRTQSSGLGRKGAAPPSPARARPPRMSPTSTCKDAAVPFSEGNHGDRKVTLTRGPEVWGPRCPLPLPGASFFWVGRRFLQARVNAQPGMSPWCAGREKNTPSLCGVPFPNWILGAIPDSFELSATGSLLACHSFRS